MCVADSLELGWPSVLARVYDEATAAETFTDPATSDLFIYINLRGTGRVEVKRPSGWSVAHYRPGTLAATSPGNTSTLRWRSPPDDRFRSLHVHLGAPLLESTAEALGVADPAARLPDTLQFEDEFVLAAGRALHAAIYARADALYAQSIAQTLAVHLLHGRLLRVRQPPRAARLGALSGSQLEQVADYMVTHLAESLALDDLAGVVNLSKFHFLRSFKLATGTTPHRRLTELRMQRAAELLQTTDLTVLAVATACGYTSARQFGVLFKRHHGAAPAVYRLTARRC